MKNKELKNLSRLQLLEMLLTQTERVEELEKQLLEKDSLLAEMQSNIETNKLKLEDAGTLAQAALQMNEVFQRADKAAAQYIENIRQLSEDAEILCLRRSLNAKKEAEEIVANARLQAEDIIRAAQEKRKAVSKETLTTNEKESD